MANKVARAGFVGACLVTIVGACALDAAAVSGQAEAGNSVLQQTRALAKPGIGKDVIWRGQWKAKQKYVAGNLVRFKGEIYLAQVNVAVGARPDESDKWQLFANSSQPGPAGPAGPAGADGSAGAQGPVGAQGPAGPQGDSGVDGADGVDGVDGQLGPQGLVGPAGPQGPEGQQGPQGPTGTDGARGADGAGILSGSTAPSAGLGKVGDFYLNLTNHRLYGPKNAGGWGGGAPLGASDEVKQFMDRLADPAFQGSFQAESPYECYLGEIRLAPYALGIPLRGQTLSVSQNTALFSLIGTTYGGNGVTTFALPDLRGMAPDGLVYSMCMQGIFPSRVM